MATDLNQVMADFAQTGQGHEDEDELMAELNAMVAEQDDAGPPPRGEAVPGEAAARAAALALEAKHAEYDAQDALRVALPDAPKDVKRLEKRSLLSDDAAAGRERGGLSASG